MATYAIGDIHGRLDYLRELTDLRLPLKAGDLLVFIGDYVDRGPDSRGVIEFLIHLSKRQDCIFLRGNHEDMLLRWLGRKALGGAVRDDDWIYEHGGAETLESYGAATKGFWARRKLRRSASLIPAAHVEFLEQTRLTYEDPQTIYVHAGLNPEKTLEEQSPTDLLTIREGWIDRESGFGKRVVHGHTPTAFDGGALEVRFLPHRINLDTGCGRHPRGYLSAVRLEDETTFDVGSKRG
jgi:serine/threonine protein phosphatase 1